MVGRKTGTRLQEAKPPLSHTSFHLLHLLILLALFRLLTSNRSDHRNHRDGDNREQCDHQEDKTAREAPSLVQAKSDSDRGRDEKKRFGDAHERVSLQL
jgi:hypothetical protein